MAGIAGVSRGLLYHYFPTKRDFFAAVVQRESDRMLRMTAAVPRSSRPGAAWRRGSTRTWGTWRRMRTATVPSTAPRRQGT
ncbi:hypothetical protein SHIRM173S_11900 [Streptomyces hirsutus]